MSTNRTAVYNAPPTWPVATRCFHHLHFNYERDIEEKKETNESIEIAQYANSRTLDLHENG